MKIFISHIAEDEKLAIALKDWIEKSFLGQIEIFVSSDPNDILIGDQWFKEIEKFLSDSNLIIALITKLSGIDGGLILKRARDGLKIFQ